MISNEELLANSGVVRAELTIKEDSVGQVHENDKFTGTPVEVALAHLHIVVTDLDKKIEQHIKKLDPVLVALVPTPESTKAAKGADGRSICTVEQSILDATNQLRNLEHKLNAQTDLLQI